MPVRLPTVEDLIISLKEKPQIFLFGVIFGTALGSFFGWGFGASGLAEITARAELLSAERDKVKEEYLTTRDNNKELLSQINVTNNKYKKCKINLQSRIEKSSSDEEDCNTKIDALKKDKATSASNLRMQTKINTDLQSKIQKQSKQNTLLQAENTNLKQKLFKLAESKKAIELPSKANCVLVYLFSEPKLILRTPSFIAHKLKTETNMVVYYADILKDKDLLVDESGYVQYSGALGHSTTVFKSGYALTKNGRAYIVKQNLLTPDGDICK